MQKYTFKISLITMKNSSTGFSPVQTNYIKIVPSLTYKNSLGQHGIILCREVSLDIQKLANKINRSFAHRDWRVVEASMHCTLNIGLQSHRRLSPTLIHKQASTVSAMFSAAKKTYIQICQLPVTATELYFTYMGHVISLWLSAPSSSK